MSVGSLFRPIRIAVVGEREASAHNCDAARAIGFEIARRGGVLVCGGLGGIMEAASEGCASGGGIVLGVLPSVDATDANRFVTVPVVTGMEEGRNVIIARTADAMVAVGGSYGTLSEIAFALRLGVPVVGLATWRFEAPSHPNDEIVRAITAEEAIDRAWSLATARRSSTSSMS